jgi:hypothetical protein
MAFLNPELLALVAIFAQKDVIWSLLITATYSENRPDSNKSWSIFMTIG